jgi:hypothetical protein
MWLEVKGNVFVQLSAGMADGGGHNRCCTITESS